MSGRTSDIYPNWPWAGLSRVFRTMPGAIMATVWGAWRMRDLFDALDMPVSILANAAIYDHAPELMAAFRARGHEVVGQPYRLRHLRRALHHICAQRGEILLITSGAIHAYCRDSIPELIV